MSVSLEHRLARRRMRARVDTVLPLELSKKTSGLEVRPGPIGKPGGPGLWKVKGMGFPPYFQNVRNALIRSGHSVAEASEITWAAIRRWARGAKTGGEYGHIHPEVVKAARSALAGIAKDSARAHAASAARREAHAHATVLDQLILREFSCSGRVIEFADPYHDTAGKFTSAGNQGSGQGKTPPPTNQGNKGAKPISPKQKATYLKDAAIDQRKATALRQEAAKVNKQITALSALIAQEQKYLATASTGTTNANTSGTAAATTGTSTATGTKTATAAGTATSTGTGTTTGYNPTTTRQMLANNQAQLKQLISTRDKLIQQANQLDAQAQNYLRLAAG